MKRIDLEPRSPEWMDLRNESLTASMAAVFFVPENLHALKRYAADKGVELDIDPLIEVGIESFFDHTPWTLWADKMGRIPRFRGNEDTERGVRNEDKVVSAFERTVMTVVEREVTATCEGADSWILASFDALAPASSDPSVVAPNGFPVEAKCPAFTSRKKLWDSRKAGKPAIMGLPYYWCQVQHQILVAEAPYGWFVAAGVELNPVTGKEEVVYPLVEKVVRDDKVLRAYKPVIEFFYKEFILGTAEPPKLPSDEKLIASLVEKAEFDRAVASGETDVAVEMYLEALKEEAEAAKRRKELEAKVLAAAAAMREEGSATVLLADRLEVTYSTSTSVSWQKVTKALVEKFGLKEVPEELLEAAKGKPQEKVKIKEVSRSCVAL